MSIEFTFRERTALCELLTDETGDIVIRTDRDGFVLEASAAFERLGFGLPNMLIGPHLVDLADGAFAEEMRGIYAAAASQCGPVGWHEFPARSRTGDCQWYALQLRPLTYEDGELYGMLGIMRSIEERRDLEERLFAAAMTDPLTGLANRGAFLSMLGHLVKEAPGGTLAVLAVDHFRAINAKFGETTGDNVLTSFAEFLQAMLRFDHIIARIGSDSFAVLMPHDDLAASRSIGRQLLRTLKDISGPCGGHDIGITASAGLAPITHSADDTLRAAELALFMAKQSGRSRLQVGGAVGNRSSNRLAGPAQHAA